MIDNKVFGYDKEGEYQYRRETIYDWVRLIATIFVVVGHSAYLTMQTTYGGVEYILPQNLSIVYNFKIMDFFRYLSGWVYTFHMPLFFMLSGAVLALKPMAVFDKFFKSKVKRLLIPYFVYSWLFMLPVKWLGNFYDTDSLKAAMKGVLSGQDSGHLWFLTALFWCLIIFVALKKFLDRLNITSVYGLLLLSGVIQLCVGYAPFDILGMKKGLGYIFYFSLGYIFQIERRSHKKWNIRKTITATIILFVLEYINKRYSIINSFFLIIIGSFLTFLLADICDRMFPKILKKRLGKIVIRNLFYVYIFHDPLEYIVLRIFFNNAFLESGLGCILYIICRTMGIFIVTIILGEGVRVLKKIMNGILCDRCPVN